MSNRPLLNRRMPEHMKKFFNAGNDFNRHQDLSKFRIQLGQIQREVNKKKSKKGIAFIKEQRKLIRF